MACTETVRLRKTFGRTAALDGSIGCGRLVLAFAGEA
jgi:hypothetical protein